MEALATLKRKELQKLAKKHGLKANSTNETIIRELSGILNADNKTKEINKQAMEEDMETGDNFKSVEEEATSQDVGNDIAMQDSPTTLYPVLTKERPTSPVVSASMPLYPTLTPSKNEVTQIATESQNTGTCEIIKPTTRDEPTTNSHDQLAITPDIRASSDVVPSIGLEDMKLDSPVVRAAPTAKHDSRREELLHSKKTARVEAEKDRKATKKSALSTIGNRVSGANRPVAKLKPTKENIAKAAATQKANEKRKKRVIDFEKVHAKQFNNMTSIAQHQKTKDARALDFLLGFPPLDAPASSSATPTLSSSSAPFSFATPSSAPAVVPFAFKPPPSSTSTTVSTTSTSFVPTPVNIPTPSISSTTATKLASSSNVSKTPAKTSAKTPAKILPKKISKTPSKPPSTPSSSKVAPTTPANTLLHHTKPVPTLTVPAFVPLAQPPSSSSSSSFALPSTPHFATNSSSSVFLSVKEITPQVSSTPKSTKPKPSIPETKTPLKENKPTLSAVKKAPSQSTPAPASASKPKVYVPRVYAGPVPKFEGSSFSSFSPAPPKPIVKPTYNAKQSLASAKKIHTKKTIEADNKENTVNAATAF